MSNDPSYYRGFSAEQYAADEFFQSWVLSPDLTIDSYWETYLNLNPAEVEQVQSARILVLHLAADQGSFLPLSPTEKATVRSQIFDQLDLDDKQEDRRLVRRKPLLYAAASILAVVAVSTFLFVKSPAPPQSAMIIEKTKSGETRQILLPDSSMVILNAGSSLSYNSDFNSPVHREVILEGNAFFKVRKLADHKNFVVHSRAMAITVLGTQFNVNSRNASVEVGLISGRVKVDAVNQSAFMLPGEQVVFDSSSRKLSKSALDTTLYTAWTENTWNFRRTSMEKVIELLEKYYGVEAEFRTASAKQKKITASIPVGDLDLLTLILSKTFHTQIKRIDNRLIIQ